MKPDRLLRGMAVESFVVSWDNMASANNYWAYHRKSDKHSQQWIVFDYDYDAALDVDFDTMQP